tara:strand:+ start:1195 stop:3135 length:1941 start_codon:yes stop_codon:yes gene_type:complete
MMQSAAKLTENPFYILDAQYNSSASDLLNLVEDAEFDGKFSSDVLHRAQQVLVTPRTRLMAELSWLPELSGAQIHKVFALLEKGDHAELLDAIEHFPELARANIAAHICVLHVVGQKALHFLASAWDDVDAQYLLSCINQARAASGFPKVEETQIKEALDDLQAKHAVAAAESVWKTSAPGQLMNDVVEAELDRDPSAMFLKLFVSGYDSRSEPDLARIEADINVHLEKSQKVDHTLASHVDAICELLDAWDNINQPVQIYEQHRGHEEGRSKRIYSSVRSVYLELANEHGKFQEALQLSETLLHTFLELASVAEVLKKDVGELQSLTEQQAQEQVVEPLIDACEKANETKRDRLALRKSLERHGFALSAKGNLGDIVRAFDNAENNLEDPSIAFITIRELALNINNEQGDPETAFRLIDGLLTKVGGRGPKEIVAKLEDERAVLHKNWKMGELDQQSGNLPAMSKTIEELLKYATGSDRTKYLKLKSKIDQAKTRKKIKFSIFAAIAGAFVYFIYFAEDSSSSRSTPQSTSTNSTYLSSPSSNTTNNSTSSSNSYEENKPPAGRDRVLTRNQIRYCIFQGKRLDYMKQLTQSQYEINRFNSLIDDYNSRCSSFRYRQGTLSAIEREAASRAGILRDEARRIVSSW